MFLASEEDSLEPKILAANDMAVEKNVVTRREESGKSEVEVLYKSNVGLSLTFGYPRIILVAVSRGQCSRPQLFHRSIQAEEERCCNPRRNNAPRSFFQGI